MRYRKRRRAPSDVTVHVVFDRDTRAKPVKSPLSQARSKAMKAVHAARGDGAKLVLGAFMSQYMRDQYAAMHADPELEQVWRDAWEEYRNR